MGDFRAVPPDPFTSLSRRRLLGGLVATPLATLVVAACGGDDSESKGTTTTAGGGTTTVEGGTAGSTPSDTGAWASGGTDLITVAYPDDAIFTGATMCAVSLTQATTEGPCYFQSDTGEDISLGKTGLPMQLCLQLVDSGCEPLADRVIEVWHCDTEGIYSGDTSDSEDAARFAGDFCTGGDADAQQAVYLRGQLTTDAGGRVNFKTIFPGWYAGRTIHIHFAVSDADGTTRVISQFCFPDEFAEEICTTHDRYVARGVQDTPLAGGSDTVFPASGYEAYMLTVEQNDDGTLLGYAAIAIDPDAVATEADGGGPGGGPPDIGDAPFG